MQADVVLDDRLPCDLEEDRDFLGMQWDTRAVRMPIPVAGSAAAASGAAGSSSSSGAVAPLA